MESRDITTLATKVTTGLGCSNATVIEDTLIVTTGSESNGKATVINRIVIDDDSSTDSDYDFVISNGEDFVSCKYDQFIQDNKDLEPVDSIVVEEVPFVETEEFPFRRKDFLTKENPNVIDLLSAEEEYNRVKESRRNLRFVERTFRMSARERLNANMRCSEISAFSLQDNKVHMVPCDLRDYLWKNGDEPRSIIHFLFYYCPKIGYYFVDIDRLSNLAKTYGEFLIRLSYGRLKSDFKDVDKPLPIEFQMSMLKCFKLPIFKWVLEKKFGGFSKKRYRMMHAQGGDKSEGVDGDVALKTIVNKSQSSEESLVASFCSLFETFSVGGNDGSDLPLGDSSDLQLGDSTEELLKQYWERSSGESKLVDSTSSVSTGSGVFIINKSHTSSSLRRYAAYSDAGSSFYDDVAHVPLTVRLRRDMNSFYKNLKNFVGVNEFSNDAIALFKTTAYDFLRNLAENIVQTICSVCKFAVDAIKDVAKLFYSFVMVVFRTCKNLTERGIKWFRRLLMVTEEDKDDELCSSCGNKMLEGQYVCDTCGARNRSSSASGSDESDIKLSTSNRASPRADASFKNSLPDSSESWSDDKGKSKSKKKTDFFAQGADDDYSWVVLVGDLLSAVVSFVPAFNKHGYDTNTLKDYFKDYSHVQRGMKTMSESKIAERMTNYFVYGDAMQGPHGLEERAKELRIELAQLHEACCGSLDVKKTVELGHQIIEKHQALVQIRLDLLGAGYNAAQMSAINLTINSLQTTVNAIKRLHRQRGVRPRPVVVFLHGEAGCGKSKIAERIGKDVLRYIKENYPKSVYENIPFEQASFAFDGTRNQEYYEGYSNQFCLRIEEIYTSIDDQINQNWSRNLFSWADHRPVELNTAFEDKGMVYFTSPMIVCTTNREGHVVGVLDAGAYQRRLDFDLTVSRSNRPSREELAKQYNISVDNPRIDALVNRVEAAVFNKMEVTDQHWNFVVKNTQLFDKDSYSKSYEYKQLVKEVAKTVIKRSIEESDVDDDYDALFAQSIWGVAKAVSSSGSAFLKMVWNATKTSGDLLLTGASVAWFNMQYGLRLKKIVDEASTKDFWGWYRQYETNDEYFQFVTLTYDLRSQACDMPEETDEEKIIRNTFLLEGLIRDLKFESKIVRFDDHVDHPSRMKVLFMALFKQKAGNTHALIRNYASRLSLVKDMSIEEAINTILTDCKAEARVMGSLLKWDSYVLEKFLGGVDNLRSHVVALLDKPEERDKFKVFIGCAMAAAAVAAGYMMTRAIISRFDPEYVSQSDDGKQPKIHPEPVNKRIAAIVHSAQSSQNIRNLEDRMARQTWCIVNEVTVLGYCVFLNNNTIAVPRHVWTAADERFILYNPTLEFGKKMVWKKSDLKIILEPEGRDLYFVRVPITRMMKKIKLLPKEDTIRLSTVLGSSFYHQTEVTDKNGDTQLQVTWLRAGSIKRPKVVNEVFGIDKDCLRDVYWVENPHNKTGYCGRPYIAEVANVSYCLMLHIAGSAHGSCYGVPLYAEDVDLANKNIPIYAQCMQTEFHAAEPVTEVEDWVFESSVHTKATNTTVFVPTQLVGPLGPPLKIPANLGEEAYQLAKKKAEPFHECIVLHEDTYTILNEKGVDFLNRDNDYLVNDYELKECRFLTVEESLYGRPGEIDGFDFSTADGMILKHLEIKKKEISDPENDKAKFLIDYIGKIWLGIMAGNFPFHTAAEALKDELRDLERVAQKKTRIFFVHDFVYNVLMKMALGDFVTKWKKRLGVHSHACGITPGTSIWKKWFLMFKVDFFVVCGDVSGNDYMHSPAIVETIIKYLLQFYPSTNGSREHTNVIVWAIMGLIYAVRFNKGKGDFQQHGNTSGNYLTTLLNTLQLVLMKCTCFYIAAKKMTDDPDAALKKLIMIIYSDDNISQSPYEWWNIHTFAALAKKYFNATITATDKSDKLESFPITQADFLSRRFVPHEMNPHIICAPLAYESLISQLYFVRKAKGGEKSKGYILKQLEQNLSNVKLELLHYKYVDATAIVEKVNASLKESHYSLKIDWYPSRTEHYRAFLERYI